MAQAGVIKVTFKVDGEEYEVAKLGYSLDQNVDNIGRAAGEVRGGTISVTLRSLDNEARYSWMVAPDMKKSGEIIFYDGPDSVIKTLEFKDAFCVGYSETYEAFTAPPSGQSVSIKDGALEHLTLSCREIGMNGEAHKNSWEK